MKTLKWTDQKCESFRPSKDSEHYFKRVASAKIGKGAMFSNAIELEATLHINGSGGTAFGGAKNWPVVKLEMPFEEGQYARRDAFMTALQAFVTEYFKNEKQS